MAKLPLISVIMPVYNAAPFLLQAVQSILAQTLDDFELIAVDDGSTDDSADRLTGISDSRLMIIRRPHAGVFSALNTGLQAARGLYVARMDADDIALAKRLQEETALLEEQKLEWVATGVEAFSDSGQSIPGQLRYTEWLNQLITHDEIIRNIFIEDPMPSPTILTRRDLLLRLGGWDPDVYPDDYNLTLKAFKAGIRFGKTKNILLRWRDHSGRLSRTASELRDQRFFRIKCKYFAQLYNTQARPIVLWGLGRNAKRLYHALVEAGIRPDGFTAAPDFIREKSLYGHPIRRFEEFKQAYFILATAARQARENAEYSLQAVGLKPVQDFIAFC